MVHRDFHLACVELTRVLDGARTIVPWGGSKAQATSGILPKGNFLVNTEGKETAQRISRLLFLASNLQLARMYSFHLSFSGRSKTCGCAYFQGNGGCAILPNAYLGERRRTMVSNSNVYHRVKGESLRITG